MCWAAIWQNTSTEIQVVDKDPNAPRGGNSAATYIELLEDQLPQFYEPHMIFQQDNAPIHRAAVTLAWLADNEVNLMEDWPPYSPDLNCIEHLWARLRDELLKYTDGQGKILRRGGTVQQDLLEAVTMAFNDIEESFIESLTSSFFNRLRAVKANHGWYTKY